MDNKNTLLIFTINTTKYALTSSWVKEIVTDEKIFPLPFVPHFISGLINRHGEPYTIIDPAVLFGEPPQSSSLFLVLNDLDKNCLRINEVLEFINQDIANLTKLENENKDSLFFGSININQEEIPVISAEAFINKATVEIGTS